MSYKKWIKTFSIEIKQDKLFLWYVVSKKRKKHEVFSLTSCFEKKTINDSFIFFFDFISTFKYVYSFMTYLAYLYTTKLYYQRKYLVLISKILKLLYLRSALNIFIT